MILMDILGAIGFGISLIVFFVGIFKVIPDMKNEVTRIRGELLLEIGKIGSCITPTMKEDVAVLKNQFTLILEPLQKAVVQMLHSPHTPEFDRLIEKWGNNFNLNLDEAGRLKQLLIEQEPDLKNVEKFAYSLVYISVTNLISNLERLKTESNAVTSNLESVKR